MVVVFIKSFSDADSSTSMPPIHAFFFIIKIGSFFPIKNDIKVEESSTR